MSRIFWLAAPALLLALGPAACNSPAAPADPAASSLGTAAVEPPRGLPEPAPNASASASGRPRSSDERARELLALLDALAIEELPAAEELAGRACLRDASATPAPPSPGLIAFARAENALAIDLYRRLRTKAGNVAFSPLSITATLAMTWAGAKGQTADQMRKVLHFEGTPDEALGAAGEAVRGLGGGRCFTLHAANRLFGETAYSFEKPYLDKVESAFGAPLERLDFARAGSASRDHINGWVARETRERIKDLIPEGVITSDTRLVLVSAIDFVGDWEQPFDRHATGPAAFRMTATRQGDAPTMHASGRLRRMRGPEDNHESAFKFAATDGVKLLEMAYLGSDLAMTLVLPDTLDGLDAIEKRLSPGVLDGWIAKLDYEVVGVSLPKFEIAPRAPLALSHELTGLGMGLAFDPARADFTGIAAPPRPRDRLYISTVLHRALVKVDEKGTEASAATSAHEATVGAAPRPLRRFDADHPFLFFLRDTRSNMILFMGRVSDPAGG